MDDQPIVRFVTERETHLGDCTISAFAMALGITYSEALVTIAAIAPDVLEAGATWRTLQRAAGRHDAAFAVKRRFDLNDADESSGILGVTFTDGEQHAVYFKRGLIFDGRTAAVWDADVYLRVRRAHVSSLLVRTK